MMRNIILTVVFFIVVLSIPYIVDAGVIIQPKKQPTTSNWDNTVEFQEFYTSSDGLYCANQIYQVYQNGLYQPSRRCRMPNQSWQFVSF